MRSNKPVQQALSVGQATLLDRHRRALERLASNFAHKNGMQPAEIMFVLADGAGRIGSALRAALPVASIGPVVLPGRAVELEAWVERLAVHGPVWDLTVNGNGIAVVVIDRSDAMALVRVVPCLTMRTDR